MSPDPQLFAIDTSLAFGDQVSRAAAVSRPERRERTFDDKGHKASRH